ncbi:S8 family serine peptidase [Sinorhizobium meliloti]|nr:S8 family serine peptidase [Sinorhizobium meliloti]
MSTRIHALGAFVGAFMGLGIPDVSAEGRNYAIRVDPSRADIVQSVLAEVAEPIELVVREGEDFEATLREICDGKLPIRLDKQAKGVGWLVRYSPCLKWRPTLTKTVRPGHTLEALAKRYGLHPSAAQDLVVSPPRPAGKILPGDRVTIPKIPDWTRFTSRAPWETREALVGRFAEPLGCGNESAEDCLLRLGVYLLDSDFSYLVAPLRDSGDCIGADCLPSSGGRASSDIGHGNHQAGTIISAPALLPEPSNPGELPSALNPVLPPPPFGSEILEPPVTRGRPSAVSPALPVPTFPPENLGPAIPEILGPPLESVLSASTFDIIPPAVARGQWPYDVERVQKMLLAALAGRSLQQTIIGIAEGGLRDSSGAPLPPQIFAAIEENGVDGIDNNGDGVVDNSIGFGASRDEEGDVIGDVALCDDVPPPDYSLWDHNSQLVASHGAMVASLAAGVRLLAADPKVAPVLPRIAFFRVLPNACEANRLGLESDNYIKAMEHLTEHASIVNFSFIAVGNGGLSFAQSVKDYIDSSPDFELLIVPAGNGPEDLDAVFPCPPCLANTSRWQSTSRRVLVVGAATQELRRANFSGYGENTVQLYAPGEPSGAIDLLGRDSSDVSAATSWAAPRAAFAAGVLRRLGVTSGRKLKARLLLASWPLLDANGNPDASGARVLDITKAVAVRHYAVEAFVAEDGSRVRKTYVGDLATPLSQLAICSTPMHKSQVQAVRLGPKTDGGRRVTAWTRFIDPNTQSFRKLVNEQFCQPSGTLQINDLIEGEITLSLDDVTHILMPWE